MGMVRSRASSSRLSSSRPTRVLFRRLKKSASAAFGFYVGNRVGDGHLSFAFHDEKCGGTKFAFATNDFAFAKTALHNGAAIQFQKCSGNSGEDWHAVQFFGAESLRSIRASNRRAGRTFIRQRAGRA